MNEKHCFLMPDYYKSFLCKMGKCRKACCEGWPVTISVEDYFRMMGCECSEDLRCRIDKGVKISLSPTPDAYAEITHKYDGSCHMRLEDGRCAIQGILGEEFLSDVCRLYPRGIRIEPDFECSCSNSCEGVLEKFQGRTSSLEFTKEEAELYLPPFGKRAITYNTFGKEQKIRIFLIKLMQNRELSLKERFYLLGDAFENLEKLIDTQDEKGIVSLIEGNIPETSCNDTPDLTFGLNTIKELLKITNEKSSALEEYGKVALSELKNHQFENLKSKFEEKFSDFEIFSEHVIVNHMFFEQFPFQDRPLSLWNEYISLCAVYALLRFLLIGCISTLETKEDFIDLCSSFFRLVDHSSFETYASKTLKYLNCTTKEKLYSIVSI